MRKTLLNCTVVLFALSINGCLKREVIVNPQQQVSRSVITPNTPIETPIQQSPEISTPSINEPIYQSTTTPIPSIAVPPPVEEATPIREIETPPPSTAGESHQLRTVQGTTIAIQERSNGFVFPQYSNKIVLLQIFGQECPYCLKEMPTIAQVQQQYAGSLQIVAVQAQEPMSQATASMLIQQYQMNYPIIDKEEAVDLLYFLQQTYGWTGILPYTLIIKDGVTEFSFFGETSYQEINEAIQSLL